MIQGDFHGSVGAETVGSSEGQFCLVVEPLYSAAGHISPVPVSMNRSSITWVRDSVARGSVSTAH